MSQLKLTYFNMRGRCEPIRYLLASVKMVYEDKRIEFSDWPKLKPGTPFGTLPVMSVTTGNKTEHYGTSLSAARFVAKLTGQYGSTPAEQGLIDGIVDYSNEIREDAIPIVFCKDPVKKEELITEYTEKVKVRLANLAKLLKDQKYFVGNKLSWADIHFMGCVEVVLTNEGLKQEKMLDGFPKLKELYMRIQATPNIAKWIKDRPVTEG